MEILRSLKQNLLHLQGENSLPYVQMGHLLFQSASRYFLCVHLRRNQFVQEAPVGNAKQTQFLQFPLVYCVLLPSIQPSGLPLDCLQLVSNICKYL